MSYCPNTLPSTPKNYDLVDSPKSVDFLYNLIQKSLNLSIRWAMPGILVPRNLKMMLRSRALKVFLLCIVLLRNCQIYRFGEHCPNTLPRTPKNDDLVYSPKNVGSLYNLIKKMLNLSIWWAMPGILVPGPLKMMLRSRALKVFILYLVLLRNCQIYWLGELLPKYPSQNP